MPTELGDTPTRPELQLRPALAEGARPALAGVRIVDFTRVLAGPFATQMLGDMGADVIKVETPGFGDDTRSVMMQGAVGGESAFFLAMNRSKRSVAIDLKSAEGRQVALDLIGTADVVVENFTARVMRGFGMDHASLAERFPRLIYCSVSGYGRDGSRGYVAAYDYPISAEAGLTALNAGAGTSPVQGMTPFTDLSAAYNAVIGILGALHARTATGRGQHVDVSMFATALGNLTYNGFHYLATGKEQSLSPEQGARPRGLFQTADGAIVIVGTGAKMFRKLCEEIWERPDWLEDPRFTDEAFRMSDRDVLLPQIRALFASRTSAEWARRCHAAGVPCGEVRSPGEALMSDAAQEAGLVFDLPHPTVGTVPAIAHGFRMTDSPFDYRAPPVLAQHSRELLAELGYDDERIEALAARGAIGLARDAPG